MPDATSSVSVARSLARRAARTPDRTAYIFLADGEEEQDRLTYAGLNTRARAIAAALSRSCRPGDRALLLYPPGLDFVAAFFGCLYAGVIAVPAYPPRSPRMMPRLQAILADARPAVALAAGASLQRVRGWLERAPEAPEAAALPWLATDELAPAPAGWEPPAPEGNAVAFLQYTSGSTSTPKGVMVTQANLVHNQQVIQEACGHSEESVFVSWLPPYHDLGLIGNLLQAVWVGAPCVLMAPVAFLQSPARWLRAISRYRGTTSGGPNFAYDLCARRVPPAEIEKLDLSSWQVAFNGAEPVREETLARFAEAFALAGFRSGALYPCYGLAEATLMVSGGRPGAEPVVREIGGRRLVGCGHVLSDLEVAIVEPDSGTACLPGAVGEIWVAGGSVARGYWNRPAETAESFGATLSDGFGDGPGRWLRTGDLGVLDGGELFVAGRLKDLIILRGRNHYPQDLEATAREAHPALAGGTGAAFSVDLEGEERLVIVLEAERHAARPDEIAAAVRQAIARDHEALTYEVVLVPAGSVPRTTSGKVQRRACRDLYLQGGLRVLGASRLSGISDGAAEEDLSAEALPGSLDWLRRAFATAARVDPARIDPDRPLSASGLDSLAAVELKHAVEEATGVPLPLADLLEGMTLRELERQAADKAPHPLAPSPTRTYALPGEGEPPPSGEHPLSWNQHSLWFLHRLAPESAAYNIAGAARLHAADVHLLSRAIQALVDRHPMLRTTYADTPEGPVQRVADRGEAGFAVVNATGWSDEEVSQRLHEEAFRPFDLAAGPLLRTALLSRGGEAFLVLAVHHIAADFWSMTVLARELGLLVAGEAPPPPAALYTDFARRQQEMLESPAGERLWEHWRERLDGAPQLDLPTDRPRKPVQTLRSGARTALPLPERAAALHRLATEHVCTPFVALFAAWQTVLGRWSGQETFLVGAPMAGRPAHAWSDVVGYFVNPVPLRANLGGGPTVRELMARARSTVLDALPHQDLPFALLTERLQPERDPSRPPLVAALLTFEKAPAPELAALAAFPVGIPDVRLDLGGLALESFPLEPPAAQLDLSLMAAELPDGLAVSLQWDAGLFDEAIIERMLGHLDRLLAGMAGEGGRPVAELPLLAAAERDQILLAWSGARSGSAAGTGCLHELFEVQAALAPETTALIDGDERWTYGALNRRANQVAHHLRRLGAGPEQRVGVLMGRSGGLVAALLGVLKAGAAYVPLDPAYPPDWLSHAAEDAGIELLLTEARFRGQLAGRRAIEATDEALAGDPGENPVPLAGPGNLAYVMYTSGSTGRPKGVSLEHRAPVERMLWARAAFPAEVLAGVLASTSICFDLSVFELFAPLSWGGTVILAENALALPTLPAAGEVTLINTVPSAMAELAVAELPPRLRIVNLAGEALPPPLAERIYRHAQIEQVFNLYGPTEDATYSTWARIERGASRVTIGQPLPGTRAYVLDRHFEPAPGGVPGELFLTGAGGARGYFGRPALTAERFLPDPFAQFPGGRLYRTGDLARWLASGELEHLGRLDHQVKVRGFRIELEEIERVLREHPQIREAAVVVRESPGGPSLAAFVAPAEVGVPELRRHLESRLPAYMVPSSFQLLPALPRTLNGKIDRRALPAGADGEAALVAPRTPLEEVLAGLWADVLGLERVGLHESFFDLGGHSLLANRVVSRLHAVFGVELPLRALFERPSVEKLAEAIEEARHAGTQEALPPLLPVPRGLDLPLSFAQERLWFLDRLAPGQAAYNIPMALRLRGPVSPSGLAAALAAVAERHEALRASFPEVPGQPIQEISSVPRFPLTVIDLTGLPPAIRLAEAARQAGEEARRPFDLVAGPLCRAALLSLDGEEHVFLLDVHHIAFDGWSMDVLLRDLGHLYIGEPLPPLPVQYADFAVWQRAWLDGGALAAQLDAWRARLAGAPAALDLPVDRRRPPVQTFRGGAEPVTLPADLVRELRAVGRRAGATLFMTVLAGWSTLLHRVAGAPELLVGTPVANRRQPELGDLIGLFVNTLPLRIDLEGDPPFAELLGRVRAVSLAAYENQDVPFERLVEVTGAGRDLARSPLFQVMLALAESAPSGLHLPGVTAEEMPLHNGTAKLELLLALTGADGGLSGGLEFNADLFDAATARRLTGQLLRLLAAAAAGPELRIADLPLLDAAEERQILVEWNATAAPFPRDLGLHELFEVQVARTPRATALVHGEQRVTYVELNARAEGLARHLRALGVGPEVLAGVFCGRTPGMVAGTLAVLKAGGAYLPLDPAYPAERLRFLLADSGAPVVLAEESVAGALPEFAGTLVLVDHDPGAPGQEPARGFIHAEQAAYAIYTSGSTGVPKGVLIRHGSAVNRITWAAAAYPPDVLAGVLAATSLCFDLSVFEIFAPLAAGGTVILADDALALPTLPAASAVTLVNTVPSAMAELVRAGLPRSVRVVNLAGEPLRRDLAERIYAQGVEEVYNLYGPSEDTTYSTGARARRGDEREPAIGRPLPNTRAYLLDSGLRPVPMGTPGELWLGGEGLARGYLGRPDLTADRFRPDPFGPLPGSRLYRTGDLARRRADGSLDYLGRLDQQVKIRGFRIEPGEIESALLAHPEVRQAAVEAREIAGSKALVAYVAGEDTRTTAAGLREHLRERLPEHMIPAFFIALPELPLTPNGKVDRKALPAPEPRSTEEGWLPPRTPVEEVLAGIWAEVLGLERVGLHDSFFALGGHSLLAARVVSRLHEVFGVELPLRALFERPSVAELSAAVEEARRGGADRTAPPLVTVSRDRSLPLSFAQERLWFLDRLEPGQAVYNIPLALRLRGQVSAPVLAAALTAVAERHEALRTSFPEVAGQPVQEIAPVPHFSLAVVDLTGLPRAARPAEAARQSAAEARTPFDLAAGPLCRAALLRLEADEHLFLLDVHHIVFDGWSAEILLRDLGRLYAGEPLPPLPLQHADFAAWQRAWIEGGALATQLGAWRERLAGAPAALDLPLDDPRPAAQTFRGGAEPVTLPADLVRALRAAGRRAGATLFMTVLAGWSTLLHRVSGAPELLVGTPVANRRQPELGDLIGLFVNTLPLRIDLGGDPPFVELLGRVRATALAAYENQDLPFERLVEAVGAERDLSRNPLFQVMLALTEGAPPSLRLPGMTAEEVPLHNGTAKLELLLALTGADGGLSGGLEFNADLFDAATVRRLTGQLLRLLAGAAAAPHLRIGDLPLLTPAEERQILVEWNATEAPFPRDLGLHELFEAQAARTPQATALLHGGQRVTYAELNARAEGLASRLCALGVGPEVLVGVFCGRTPGMVAAALAVLKAGGAYLPLDPAYPADRLRFLLADSGAPVVLAEESVARALPAFSGVTVPVDGEPGPMPGGRPRGFLHPGQAAYAIYTSGSTGVPKGVIVRHGSAVNRIAWALSAYVPEVLSGVLAATSLCFDLSVFEIFVPLAGGGTVILADDALALPSLPAASAVTLVNTVPSAMAELVRAGSLPRSVRVVNLAGEPLRRDLAERIYAQGVEEVHNLYGPSEDTTYSTGARARRGDEREPAIGRPLPNTRAYLLDSGLRPVPVGTPGELWLGGEGLARGYLGRPDLTADRFRPDPFGPAPGGRLYRTGDLARCRADGTDGNDGSLDYLGRLDQQVKIRGFRIEPGEIESALLAHPEVRQVAVEAREIARSKALVAYVAGEDTRTTAAGLREHLRERLPEHMIPAFFIVLPELPLTPNGKVDRKALLAPEPRSTEEGWLAARTPVEEVLAGIWAEVLGVERVNVQDGFFDLGGHSLLATRVVSRLRSVFGVELPLRDLFANPGLGDLAARVEAALRAGTPQTAPPLAPRPREEPQPLSFAQQRLWFLDQLEPGSPQYNMPVELRIEGSLDPAVLARCLGEIVRRHEALRTVFTELEGSPVQVIQPPAPFVPPLIDLSGLPERARASAAVRLVGAEAVRPFDLIHGPLLRGVLLRLTEGDHTAALTLHHIVSDGWSMGILAREVTALYPAFAAGRPSPLPELPVQYADFAVWQRSWLQGEVLENEISFWRRELADLPPLLELPTDRPRPAVQSFRGATRPVRLPAGLLRRLEALARREGATLFMVLLAGLQTLLARTSGRDDLVVGSPVAGRNWTEIEDLIGFFVNTLVLRGHLRGDPTFRELLGRVRETALAAWLHQDVPFERLVEELAPERSLAHTPLFQVLFVLQNAPFGSLEIEGLRLRPVVVEGTTAKFDLTVSFSEHHDGLGGTIAYATDLFDPPTIDRLAGHLERLLAGMADRPDEPALALPLLSPGERAQLLREWNDTRTTEPGGSFFHQEVAAQAARTPEAVAVETEDERWTYGRLLAAARRLAQRLRELGVGPDAVVGLCAGRTPAMIAGLLAVLEAGGAWLPLDPDEPPGRLRFLLDDADARVLLVAEALRERVPAGGRPVVLLDAPGESGEEPAAPLGVELAPDHLAYVLYTSGSTGRPKGVAVRHSSLMHLARALRATVYAGTATALRVGVNASFSFDGSVKQLVQLAWGHTLHILGREVRLDPPALVDTVRRQRLEVLDATPSQLRLLLGAGLGLEDAAPALVLVGGEAVDAELREAALSRPRTCFWNVYGPTECTVDTTAVPFASGVSPSHIGRPLPNVQAHVVAGGGDLAPLGVSGELQVGGAGLARGYLHRPGLTAERFVPDPFGESCGGRLYRTGDLVRRLPDGSLDFLGRIDHQVKIRGFRIELGEIEAVLLAVPGVREAAVLAHDARAGTGPGDRRLVAYVAGDIAADVLLQALREQLPAYMVPAAVVTLAALPLTPNGKVDRKALPAPGQAGEGYVAPRTPLEEVLAGIWAELLGLERVGIHDDFFAIGGQSLLAAQLVAQVREIFPGELPLRTLFAGPTVAGLAAALLHDPARRAQVERTAELMLEIADAPDIPEDGEEVLAR